MNLVDILKRCYNSFKEHHLSLNFQSVAKKRGVGGRGIHNKREGKIIHILQREWQRVSEC